MKFSICNLGCKVNNYEANWYASQLALKYQEVPFGQMADIFIINSCTVTNTAGSKTRQMMHKARSINPNGIVCVVGCYPQVELDKKEIFEDCDIVIGSNHKLLLPDCIDSFLKNHKKIFMVEDFNTCDFEVMKISTFNQTRAYLKIQDGCNQFCSYCVIPFARGRERCLDADTVIDICKELVNCGHSEIVLTGIHTGRYFDKNTNLTGLIKRMLEEVDGLKRIRLSSIELTEIPDELIDLMSQDDRIAHHLHIPMQTGSDKLLKLMNRPYTTSQYLEKVNYIKQRIKDISISSDIIVGLPQESDDDFNQLCQFVKECGLSFAHIFPYAKKEKTKAALMDHQVDGNIKKKRVSQLTTICDDLYYNYCASFLNKNVNVLFERYTDGYYVGHCSEYIVVKVKSDNDIRKQMLPVQIDSIDKDCLIGSIKEGL